MPTHHTCIDILSLVNRHITLTSPFTVDGHSGEIISFGKAVNAPYAAGGDIAKGQGASILPNLILL